MVTDATEHTFDHIQPHPSVLLAVVRGAAHFKLCARENSRHWFFNMVLCKDKQVHHCAVSVSTAVLRLGKIWFTSGWRGLIRSHFIYYLFKKKKKTIYRALYSFRSKFWITRVRELLTKQFFYRFGSIASSVDIDRLYSDDIKPPKNLIQASTWSVPMFSYP